MSSQYGEEQFILAHFGERKGRFLDIGAADGETFSNTLPLLRAGWTGVMVEPAPSNIQWLLENHDHNPDVEIVPAVLLPSATGCLHWVYFHDNREFSTMMSEHRQKIEAHSQGSIKYRPRMVPSITWDMLLEWYPGPYQFVNIDVEGMNLEVLRAAPLKQFEMVCVEMDPEHAIPEMARLFNEAGLRTHRIIGGNLLAWRG